MKIFDLDYITIKNILLNVNTILLRIPKNATRKKILIIIKRFLINLSCLDYDAILSFYDLDNEEIYINNELLETRQKNYSLNYKKLYDYFVKYIDPEINNTFSKATITNITRAVLKNYSVFVSKATQDEKKTYIANFYTELFNKVFYSQEIEDEFISIKKVYY